MRLFFKQNLKVKILVGTSRNVMTQTWIALCVYMFVSYLKFVNRLGWSLGETLPSPTRSVQAPTSSNKAYRGRSQMT